MLISFFRSSLRNKLVGVFLLPTMIIVLLYGLLAYFASRQGLEDELGQRLIAVGHALSSDMSEGLDAAQLRRLDATKHRVRARLVDKLQRARDAVGVRRIFIFDRSLQSLVDTEESVEFGQRIYHIEADLLEIERVFDSAKASTSMLFSGDDGTFYKTGYVPILDDGDVIAALGVEAGADYFKLLTNFASVLTLLGALGFLSVILVGTWFARALTQPLRQLVNQAHQLGQTQNNVFFARPAQEVPGIEREPLVAQPGGFKGDEIEFLDHVFSKMRTNILERDHQMQMMLSGVAHEVRNPLGGMTLYCGLLRESLEKLSSEADEQRHLIMVDKIERELRYLESVVQDFLDYARGAELEYEPFCVNALMEEVIALLGAEIETAKCIIEHHATSETIELAADRKRLRGALINVIRNAYQACQPGGGNISIKVEVLKNSMCQIAISDTGEGMSVEQQSEIFSPFYTTKQKGSGLGLALTRQTIEHHGGTITVHSRPGEGTELVIHLPNREFQQQIHSQSASTNQASGEDWMG